MRIVWKHQNENLAITTPAKPQDENEADADYAIRIWPHALDSGYSYAGLVEDEAIEALDRATRNSWCWDDKKKAVVAS